MGCLRDVGGGGASPPSPPGAPRLASLRHRPVVRSALRGSVGRRFARGSPPQARRVSLFPVVVVVVVTAAAAAAGGKARRELKSPTLVWASIPTGPLRSPRAKLLRARPLGLLRGLRRTRRVGRATSEEPGRGGRREVRSHTGPGPPPLELGTPHPASAARRSRPGRPPCASGYPTLASSLRGEAGGLMSPPPVCPGRRPGLTGWSARGFRLRPSSLHRTPPSLETPCPRGGTHPKLIRTKNL